MDTILFVLRRVFMKTLQFVFCILACFCVAATTMVGLLWDLMYALIPAFFAVVFAALMFLVKKKRTPVEKKPDFMDPSPAEPEPQDGEDRTK